MENSGAVHQHGLEKFMEEQKEKYICQKCGGIISIHDRECSECQEKNELRKSEWEERNHCQIEKSYYSLQF